MSSPMQWKHRYEANSRLTERGLTLPSSGPAYGGPLKSNVRRQKMLRDLSASQRDLADFMSAISERLFSAGWIDGLEYKLWSAASEGLSETGLLQITIEEIAGLRERSARCDGWIVFDDKSEETFVSLPDWQQRLAVAND